MENFVFHNPTKIHFGAGRLEGLGGIAKKYGQRCMLVTTTNSEAVLQPLYTRVKDILSVAGLTVLHFDEAVPNPTVQSIEKAIALVKSGDIQMVVAVGGGSSIDTAKAIALFHQPNTVDWNHVYQTYTSPFAEYEAISTPVLPLITVPTTAGTGSELTQAMVLSDTTTDEKVCIFHNDIFPKEAIIDVELTLTLPRGLTAITGFDAFCHSFESYMRNESNVYTSLLSLQSIRTIVRALPLLLAEPTNIELRDQMCQAEMFAGIALSCAAATIPHPLSEIIGGIAPRIAHGQALACLYPSYLRFQIIQTPEKCATVARLFSPELEALSSADAAARLPALVEGFLDAIGIRATLTQLGVTQPERQQMESHFLLGVLPFGTKQQLTSIMREAF